jgi:O-6-methylguanine DNA methyltransferase
MTQKPDQKKLSLNVEVLSENGVIKQVSLKKAKSTPGLNWELIDSSGNNPALKKLVAEWFRCYLAGHPSSVKLPLSFDGLPPYTRQVLEVLREIPWGTVVTYGDLAVRTGSPRAARAVGSACGRNPFLLFVPCHRVVAAGRGMGGFACGLDVKRQLLEFEKCQN